MAVGLEVGKSTVNQAVGLLARDLNTLMERIQELDDYFDRTPDVDLTALGYTSGEVAVLKTALNDLDQLRVIWEGGANLAVAKDFRTFVQQLWGLGFEQ